MLHWLLIIVLMPILILWFFLKKNSKWCVGVVYGAGILSFAPLILKRYGIPVGLAEIPVFPAKLFTASVEYKEFVEMLEYYMKDTGAGRLVYITCLTIYVLAPACTVAVILNYVKKIFDVLYIKFHFKSDIYVFSEFNEDTLCFAEKLKEKNKKAVIIFEEQKKRPEYDMFRFMAIPLQRIYKYIPRTASAHMVFANRDENEALGQFFEFSKLEHRQETEVYIYSTKKDVEHIIDCIKKKEGKLRIRLINTEELLVLDTLWNYPLFVNMNKEDKEFNISVFGVGNMGSSFVREALWCTELGGYTAKFNLIDNGDARKNLLKKCPYMTADGKQFRPIPADVCPENIEDIIRHTDVAKSNYIFVSLGDDALNMEIASKLRLEFNRNGGRKPAIVAMIDDDNKRKLSREILYGEDIFVTGDVSMFCDVKFMDEHPVFRYGYEIFRCIQREYKADESESAFYNQIQTELSSSLSNAVHMIYKVFSVMGKDFVLSHNGAVKTVYSEEEKSLLKKTFLNQETIDRLSADEHRRWMVFEKMKGYQGIEDSNERESLLRKRCREELCKEFNNIRKICKTRDKRLAELEKKVSERFNPRKVIYLKQKETADALCCEETKKGIANLEKIEKEIYRDICDEEMKSANNIISDILKREKKLKEDLEEEQKALGKGLKAYFRKMILDAQLGILNELKIPSPGKIHKEIDKKINLAIIGYKQLVDVDKQIKSYWVENPELGKLDEVLVKKIPTILAGVEEE